MNFAIQSLDLLDESDTIETARYSIPSFGGLIFFGRSFLVIFMRRFFWWCGSSLRSPRRRLASSQSDRTQGFFYHQMATVKFPQALPARKDRSILLTLSDIY